MSAIPGGDENLVFGIRIDRSNIGPDMRAARQEIAREVEATKAGFDKVATIAPVMDTSKISAGTDTLKELTAEMGANFDDARKRLDALSGGMEKGAITAKELRQAYAAVGLALAGVVGQVAERFTGAIAENVTAMRRGEASTGDLVDATLKAIPVFNGFYQAALNVREALTGENEEIRKQTVLLGELAAARDRAGNAGTARRAAVENSREDTADMAARRNETPGSLEQLQGEAARKLRDHNKAVSKPIDDEIQKQKGVIASAQANYVKGTINRDEYEDFRDNARKIIAGLEKQKEEVTGARAAELAQGVAKEWREKVGGALIDAGGELLEQARKRFNDEVKEATRADAEGAAEERRALKENEELAKAMDKEDERTAKRENEALARAMDDADEKKEKARRENERLAEAMDKEDERKRRFLDQKPERPTFAEAISATAASRLNLMGGADQIEQLTLSRKMVILLQGIEKKSGPARFGP